MAVYHEAPFTVSPYVEIPDDAAPAVGVDEYGNREVIAEASETWAADDKIEVTVGSRDRPYEVQVTLNPSEDFAEGYEIDWDFGDGTRETGRDLVQRNTYRAPGSYSITAVVRQPGETSFALTAPVAVGDDGSIA